MVSELKHILKCLCRSHGWSSAVFWRYDQTNPMLLTLEDAYHDEQIGQVVDDMLLQVHIFGEEIIGEAALTGNHRWVFLDTAKDVFQVEHDFLTVLVVPIGSRGIVQLGSTKKIQESTEILDQTTRAFQRTDHVSERLDLDALFAPLLPPMGNSGSLGALGFDEIFAAGSCSLLSPKPSSCFTSDICLISETAPFTGQPHFSSQDESGFDILNSSYSLDHLYQYLAASPDQIPSLNSCSVSPGSSRQDKMLENCSDDHRETSAVSETDLFYDSGLNSKGSCSKRLFPELSSSSFSNHSQDFGVNPSKRQKLETSSPQSSSFFAQSCNMTSQTMTQSSEKTSSCNPLSKSEAFARWHSGLWIDDRYSSKFCGNSNSGPSKKPEEAVRKKRGKPGESRKLPRAKDRRMIQELIKELRGMIPNGAKCSIDALLDLTIKHTRFMQSISEYADKLKQPYMPKKGSSAGATWAFEVGDESVVCPIIVEDLNPPGQMRIEFVCLCVREKMISEERGQFLGIADAIRGFGLNILKAAMETRDGKIWAHFIAEGKREVTRQQVLWSILQHLQQDNECHPIFRIHL